MLRAELDKRQNGFRLQASIEVPPASTLAIVGESGSGKTTLLRLLAGLTRPDRGRIELDAETYFDSGAGTWVPPWRRRVGYVSQEPSLFPHFDVAENVAFGLRAERRPEAEIRSRVASMLELLGLTHWAERRPHELSGGQGQKVALARALILEPQLLLLDEPLSALDLQSKRSVRAELRLVLERLPCVTLYVTHSPAEAIVIGDRIAVVENGAIVQLGPPQDLLRHPRTAYVAEFMGVNLIRGVVVAREQGGLATVEADGGALSIPDPGAGGEIFLVIDPRQIGLSREKPSGTAQNSFFGTIGEMIPEPPLGDRIRVVLATRPALVAEVTRAAVEALGLRPGDGVYATFKATGVISFR
jgi:molybdate transport system ATP-binding protein